MLVATPLKYSVLRAEEVDMVSTGRVKTERDGTRAETRFGLPAKRMSPFISAGVSVQSSTGVL